MQRGISHVLCGLESSCQNILKNKCVMYDRPALDCADSKNLKLGRRVGGNRGL